MHPIKMHEQSATNESSGLSLNRSQSACDLTYLDRALLLSEVPGAQRFTSKT